MNETIWIMFIFEWNLPNNDDEDMQLFLLYVSFNPLFMYQKAWKLSHSTDEMMGVIFTPKNEIRKIRKYHLERKGAID